MLFERWDFIKNIPVLFQGYDLVADYQDTTENNFEYFQEIAAPVLMEQEESRSTSVFRPRPPNYVWEPEVKKHSEFGSEIEKPSRKFLEVVNQLQSKVVNQQPLESRSIFQTTTEDIKPFVHLRPNVNPRRKMYINKNQENKQSIFDTDNIQKPEMEKIEKTNAVNLKKVVNRNRNRKKIEKEKVEDEIVIGKRKPDDILPPIEFFTPTLKAQPTPRRRLHQRKKSVLERRTIDLQKLFKGNDDVDDYNDYGDKDQKAVEKSYPGLPRQRMSLPKKTQTTYRDESPGKTSLERTAEVEADVESGFNQMSLWRNRFESERIRNFLKNKQNPDNMRGKINYDLPPTENEKSKMRRGSVKNFDNKYDEGTFDISTSVQNTRTPPIFRKADKIESQTYSPRPLRPMIKSNAPNRRPRPSSKRPFHAIVENPEEKAEALPFISKEEKELENAQVLNNNKEKT